MRRGGEGGKGERREGNERKTIRLEERGREGERKERVKRGGEIEGKESKEFEGVGKARLSGE
jgi:hypothetical protein